MITIFGFLYRNPLDLLSKLHRYHLKSDRSNKSLSDHPNYLFSYPAVTSESPVFLLAILILVISFSLRIIFHLVTFLLLILLLIISCWCILSRFIWRSIDPLVFYGSPGPLNFRDVRWSLEFTKTCRTWYFISIAIFPVLENIRKERELGTDGIESDFTDSWMIIIIFWFSWWSGHMIMMMMMFGFKQQKRERENRITILWSSVGQKSR